MQAIWLDKFGERKMSRKEDSPADRYDIRLIIAKNAYAQVDRLSKDISRDILHIVTNSTKRAQKKG